MLAKTSWRGACVGLGGAEHEASQIPATFDLTFALGTKDAFAAWAYIARHCRTDVSHATPAPPIDEPPEPPPPNLRAILEYSA